MYYSDAYLQASYQEKMDMATTFYDNFISNYDKALVRLTKSTP